MSTYLKSAAMSVLSKTLQTFLTKYLSDVDVEGVTLPSYDGSGWGVRLSNVQLREGVQLMKTMPGTVTKKRTVKRKQRKRRLRTSKPNGEKSDPSSQANKSHTKAAKSLPQSDNRQIPLKGEEIGGNTEIKTDSAETKVVASSSGRPRTNSTFSASDLEIAVTASTDYYTDDDEIEDEAANGANGTAKTPLQKNSMFSCFYNRNSRKGRKLMDDSLHQKLQEQQQFSNGEPLLDQTKNTLSADKTETIQNSNFIVDIEKIEDSIKENDDNSYSFAENDDDIYEYYEEEEEFEEEYELPLRLCLGEQGRIGMVDVRLIGKELHVMVEDAVVTIEAIPVLPKEENADKEGTHEYPSEIPGGGNQDGGGSSVGESTNEKDDDGDVDSTTTGRKGSTKGPKPEPKRDTVGDRVLADNGLARLISAIPHLFLRDICVRLIVRDEPMTPPADDDAASRTAPSNASTDNPSIHGYSRPQASSKDTMVEVGIDFLSVTSGEDILSHFQQEHTTAEHDLQNLNLLGSSKQSTASFTESSVDSKPPSLLKIPSNFEDENGKHKNEYLMRHIRTGRGPSAGISVQFFVPNSGLSRIVTKSTVDLGDVWARQRWISSTKYHLLRCSGLDIQARIHMGTKRVDAAYSWFYGEYIEDDEESSQYDSMLLFGSGMEAVAPGPQLPIPHTPPRTDTPPAEPRMSRGNTPRNGTLEREIEDDDDPPEINVSPAHKQPPASSIHPGVDVYHIDANGIQSCQVPSSFHRVSRGMVLKSCKDCLQLPSEVSDRCWEPPSNSDVKNESSLDSSIPMPGLALQICIRDPLEINVDRNSIESIGLIKSLFTKPLSSPKSEHDNSDPKKESDPNNSTAEIVTAVSISDDITHTTSASTGFFSGLLYGKPEETIHEEEAPEDSFESYMQPESISVMGIYLADTVIRIHIMRDGDEDDRNLSFCYWQVETKCLTLDRQTLTTPEKTFSDLKLDIGRLVWDEYKGTSKTNLVSLGALLLRDNIKRCDTSSSMTSMIDDHARNKAPWPSTACALLDIAPPVESLAYKSREGHGLQLRFLSTPSSSRPGLDEVSRSMIYLRLGLTTVDSNWDIKNEIGVTLGEIMRNLSGKKKEAPASSDTEADNSGEHKNETDDLTESQKEENQTETLPPQRFSMAYTIQVDSGNILLPPLIEVKMPMSRFSGERSSVAGFSIESELGKLDFAYGAKEPMSTRTSSPLLPQIAGLPESVRMHILLCLKDLSPLELALNVKKEKNSFRRIKAVDKAILKTAKKITRRISKATGKKKVSGSSGHHLSRTSLLDAADRRQRILTEIMKLDDGELTNLWSVHQRYQKKLAKKLREEHVE